MFKASWAASFIAGRDSAAQGLVVFEPATSKKRLNFICWGFWDALDLTTSLPRRRCVCWLSSCCCCLLLPLLVGGEQHVAGGFGAAGGDRPRRSGSWAFGQSPFSWPGQMAAVITGGADDGPGNPEGMRSVYGLGIAELSEQEWKQPIPRTFISDSCSSLGVPRDEPRDDEL
ncbi:hypothetical protein CDD83_9854 [Cordyceps sp. RAO-2017]|nr:hypothetical protein CDD83_9854 [Cordyceps sp. RAO-2017]